MQVEVIGKSGWGSKLYGCVEAISFQKAVEEVFANKLLYPRIITTGKGRWVIHHMDRLPLNTSKFSKLHVTARRKKVM